MDVEAKRKALRMITYGLYVLTARSGDEIAAGTVNWLSQASFNPPLVMVALKRGSRLHDLVEKSGGFAVNILESGQKDVAAAFFGPSKVEGSRINGYEFESAPNTKAPILKDLPAWFECRVVDKVEKGDHTVFVGEVVEAGVRRENAKPLVMWETGWYYGG